MSIWTLKVRCTVIKTLRCEGTEEQVTCEPFGPALIEVLDETRELGDEIQSIELEEE
jgi:hypothetical protein